MRLQRAGLTVKMAKCWFGHKEVPYLGHIIGGRKVWPDPEKLQAIVEYPRPQTKEDVRAFLGLAGYYRRFIPQFVDISTPLSDLTKKIKLPEKIAWSNRCEEAFQELKGMLVKKPILAVMDPAKKFVLKLMPLNRAGSWSSVTNGGRQPRKSRSVRQSEPTAPREEIFYGRERVPCHYLGLKIYLYGQKFEIQSDHQPLTWLHRMKNSMLALLAGPWLCSPITSPYLTAKGRQMPMRTASPEPQVMEWWKLSRKPQPFHHLKEGGMWKCNGLSLPEYWILNSWTLWYIMCVCRLSLIGSPLISHCWF